MDAEMYCQGQVDIAHIVPTTLHVVSHIRYQGNASIVSLTEHSDRLANKHDLSVLRSLRDLIGL